jgi:hypothetical protein
MTKNFTETATDIVLFVQNYGFSTTSIRYVEGVLNDIHNNASAVVEGSAPVVSGADAEPIVDGAGGDTIIPADDTTSAN